MSTLCPLLSHFFPWSDFILLFKVSEVSWSLKQHFNFLFLALHAAVSLADASNVIALNTQAAQQHRSAVQTCESMWSELSKQRKCFRHVTSVIGNIGSLSRAHYPLPFSLHPVLQHLAEMEPYLTSTFTSSPLLSNCFGGKQISRHVPPMFTFQLAYTDILSSEHTYVLIHFFAES